MPTIGRATIDVNYNGRGMPEQARRLGEETGEAQADAHNRRLRDGLDEGYREQARRWERQYRDAGGRSGQSFSDAYNRRVTRDLDGLADRVAAVFTDRDGLANYRESLQRTGQVTDRVKDSTDALRSELKQLKRSGQLNDEEFRALNAQVTTLGRELRRTDARRAAEDMDRLRDEAERVRDAMDEEERMTRRLNDGLYDNDTIRRTLEGHGGDFGDLLEDENRLTREGDVRLQGLNRAMRDLDQQLLRLNPDVERHADLLTRVRDVVRGGGGTEDVFRRLSGEARRLGDEFEDASGDIDRAGNSARRSSGSFGKLFRGISSIDPGDNLGQLIVLIIAIAGPAAALLSALAAQAVIVGTAAAGAAVGAAALYVAFQGMFGDLSKLPAAARPAAAALQGLAGPLKRLQDQLQVATFKGLADNISRIGTRAIPALSSGVKAIGGALNDFLGNLADKIVSNRGAINDMLTGFAPIIRDVGGAATSLIGVFGGLFRAAMPFAQSFAASLSKTIGKWSDWINSIAGQKALQGWFASAQPIMAAVMHTLGQLGKTFSMLVTPDTVSALFSLLHNIDDLGPALAGISAALAPAIAAFGDLLTLAVQIVGWLDPVVAGIGNLAEGLVAIISPIVGYLGAVLKPAFDLIGSIFTQVGNLFSAVAPVIAGFYAGMQTALEPVIGVFERVLAAANRFYSTLITMLAPVYATLGQVFRLAGQAVNEFLTALFAAIGQSNAFGAAGQGLSGILNGPVKGALSGIQGVLQNVAGFIRNTVIPAIHEIDWTQVTVGFNQLEAAGPDLITVFKAVIDGIVQVVTIAGQMGAAFATGANVAITAITGMGTVIDRIMHGDVPGAMAAAATASQKTGAASGDLATAVKAAMSTSSTAYKKLQGDSSTLRGAVDDMVTKGKAALADFQRAGQGNLQGLATRFGLTGSASTVFRDAVAASAKDAGVKLAAVANSDSLPSLLSKLKITGTAAQSEWAAKTVAAAAASGVAVDKLPPKLLNLAAKYNALPSSKRTSVSQSGAEGAAAAVAALKAKIDALHDKTVTIRTINQGINKKLAQAEGGAIGGVISAAGRLMNRKRGFAQLANGGITAAQQYRGDAVIGESGPEAIVPLSGSLKLVDKSVRQLSAIARGRTLGRQPVANGSGRTVNVGGVTVNAPGSNPRQVASSVLDRLAIAVGA